MIYDTIIIDTSNLFYRLQKDSENSSIKSIINHIKDEALPHLNVNGTLYLLFDPIPKSDIDESKAFSYTTTRKKLDMNYKKDRKHSPIYPSVMSAIKKYYTYRGEKIKIVYSDYYEADDYIEPLLKTLKLESSVALVTTDEDYARYITDKIALINRGYEEPFDKKSFEEKYQFKPTVAANTLYKAIFGDLSDNITGCIFLKKVKFTTNIKLTAYNYIKEVADKGLTLNEVLDQFKNYSGFLSSDSCFNKLYSELEMASEKKEVLPTFYHNIKLIRSQLENKDISKYIHSNPEKSKFNEIQEQAIFGVKPMSWFGKV